MKWIAQIIDNCYDGNRGPGCSFENLRYGVYCRSISSGVITEPKIAIRYSVFSNNLRAIYIYNNLIHSNERVVIIENSFIGDRSVLATMFLLSGNCPEYLFYSSIDQNTIMDIFLYNTAHTVYNNQFEYTGTGINHITVVNGTAPINKKGHIMKNNFNNQDPDTKSTDNVFGVFAIGSNDMTKVSCNTFENMGTDIKIAVGATLQNPMSDKFENAAGNTFSNIISGRYRIDNTGNSNINYTLEYTHTIGGSEDPIPPTTSLNVNKLVSSEVPPTCELKCTELYTNNWGLSVRNTSYKSNQISVYPNPANSELNISINSGVISSIVNYDMLGKVVYSNLPNNFSIVIDINNFPSGMYLISITDSDNQYFSSKIIKGDFYKLNI